MTWKRIVVGPVRRKPWDPEGIATPAARCPLPSNAKVLPHRSRMLPCLTALLVPLLLGLGISCGDGGGGERRVIAITQTDDECSPAAVDVQAGEAVTFRLINAGRKDHEFEGIDGTKIEELLVPAGRTRNVNYTVPSSGAVQKVKCYIPAGPSTVIELNVTGAGGEAPAGENEHTATAPGKKVKTALPVFLQDYVVKIDRRRVPAGTTRFIAANNSLIEVHEVAVLRLRTDGSYENVGEIEDVPPGQSREMVLDLARGTYLLACLIVPGEAGSTVDHFAEGMKTELTVE